MFRQVLGTYPTGVAIVTALDHENGLVAMVVGSFTSVSLDPPLVGFLPEKKSGRWAGIARSGRFCVNVLGSDQQELCRRIATRGSGIQADADFSLSERGLPVIPDAVAQIECDIHSVLDAGDHYFVLGSVIDLRVSREQDPMLFHRGRYGSFAEIR
ncbi:flavin reductase family protein [Sphingobium fuliginis]|uniref:flavin reductase family protein n=1 Tax=Sphingobium fuliginis (strain ATCC 27551) TaxID=336203 RepID=UPI00350E5B16